MSAIFVTIWSLGLFAIGIGSAKYIRNRWLSVAACVAGAICWNGLAYIICLLLSGPKP